MRHPIVKYSYFSDISEWLYLSYVPKGKMTEKREIDVMDEIDLIYLIFFSKTNRVLMSLSILKHV